MLRHEAVWALNKRQKATQPCKVLSLISAPWLCYKLHPIYQIKQYPMWNSTKHHKCFTSIKSSSAPLKRKIIGWGGAQPESTTSLATSSSDAANRKKKNTTMIYWPRTKEMYQTHLHMTHSHQLQGSWQDCQNVHSSIQMHRCQENASTKYCKENKIGQMLKH